METIKAKPNPNAKLKLDFDYKNLRGDEFQRYIDYCEKISPENNYYDPNEYVFELRHAKPIFQERYPGLPNTPIDFVGIELGLENGVPAKPISTTQIPFRVAREMNIQVQNAHARAGHGRYYLLKQD